MNLYAYVGNSPVSYVDPSGLGRLPADPSGLGPQWVNDPTHLDPNGSRWRNPEGDYLDFHKGRPGLPGEKGKDHWHDNGCKDHLHPGDEVAEEIGEEAAEALEMTAILLFAELLIVEMEALSLFLVFAFI